MSKQAAIAQLEAIREWGVIPSENRFAMLGKIHHPALVVHGSKDVVVMAISALRVLVLDNKHQGHRSPRYSNDTIRVGRIRSGGTFG